jgi:hypothetical protein
MGELVNLRRARKSKQRSKSEKIAEANRTLHGISKKLRDAAKAEKQRAGRALGSHEIENKD